MPESPGAEKQDKEKDHRDSKKNRGETDGSGNETVHKLCICLSLVSVDITLKSCLSSSVMKTSVSMDSSDQKKTRMKLKKFLIRRPTYQAVRDKGYIKGIQTERSSGMRTVWEYLPHVDARHCLNRRRVTCTVRNRCLFVCLFVCRPGVWLQSDQSEPAGEHLSAQLCQNVHRPRGEHRYEQQPRHCLFVCLFIRIPLSFCLQQ